MQLKRILSGMLCIAIFFSLVSFVSISKENRAQAADLFQKRPFTGQLADEAIAQYESGDHSALSEPAVFNILWLGFRNVRYKNLDFRMTSFDEEYLRAVVLNFEKSVKRITNHNLDIRIDFHFIDDSVELTNDDFLYLSKSSIQDYIDYYNYENQYYSVITTIQTDGEENRVRNEKYPEYHTNYAILGVMTHDCLNSDVGYCSFNLGGPIEGTYPLQNPEIPSLYATAVAVHEWMHQLESIGSVLDIEYPSTHAYIGPSEFPGYQAYESDKNNYDFFEFYELVLQGKLPYREASGNIRYVGMYPKMWKFLTESCARARKSGYFTISTQDGNYYLAGDATTRKLTLSKTPYIWSVTEDAEGFYVISSKNNPELRFDLNNAWDSEGNTVGLHVNTGYVNAQRWNIVEGGNGTYSIRTAYESGRSITIENPGDEVAIKTYSRKNPSQQWFTCREGENPASITSTLKVSLSEYPSLIENGGYLELKGEVSSNYPIETISVIARDKRGNERILKEIYPDSDFVKLEDTRLGNGVRFDGQPGNVYNLVIVATDGRATKSVSKEIEVVKTEAEVRFNDRNKNGITVYINGKKIAFDVQPRIMNNRTMVPMRAIFEELGADVSWDGVTRTAIGKTAKQTIKIGIGKDYLLKNDVSIPVDSPAVIISGRTLVPIRVIAESLDCKVIWHKEIQVVEILK